MNDARCMLSMHTRGLFVEFAGAVPRLGVMRSIENMFYHGVLRRLRRSDLRAVRDNGIHDEWSPENYETEVKFLNVSSVARAPAGTRRGAAGGAAVRSWSLGDVLEA